jgi:hypothetical protein
LPHRLFRPVGDFVQQALELGVEQAQFADVGGREAFQDVAGLGGQGDDDLAAVVGGAGFPDDVGLDQSIDEFDGGVVADDELVGDLRDGDAAFAGRADGENRLVLLRRQAGGAGGRFTEGEELAQAPPERGERLVFPVSDRRNRCR